jgi:hypothetical protein
LLDTLDSNAGWFTTTPTTTILPPDTVVRAQGIASFAMDWQGGAGVAQVRRWLIPQDLPAVQRCLGRGIQVSFFHLAPPQALNARMRLVYQYDETAPVPVPTAYDEYNAVANTGTLINGMWLNSFAYDSPTFQFGLTGNDDPLRRRLISLLFQWESINSFTQPGRIDAVRITPTPDAQGNFNPCGVGVINFGIERLIVPGFLGGWLRNPQRATTLNSAQTAHEIVQRGAWEQVRAQLQQVRSDTLRESLRRFSAYAQGRSNWGITRIADELVDTTVTATSGPGGSTPDPRRVDVDDTLEIERLVAQATPITPVTLRVGPNFRRQVEVGEVQAVVPGSHVILREPLTYFHEIGSYVRSRHYYPRCAVNRSGDPVQVTGRDWNFDLNFREVV